jgi:hypothetical protein
MIVANYFVARRSSLHISFMVIFIIESREEVTFWEISLKKGAGFRPGKQSYFISACAEKINAPALDAAKL